MNESHEQRRIREFNQRIASRILLESIIDAIAAVWAGVTR